MWEFEIVQIKGPSRRRSALIYLLPAVSLWAVPLLAFVTFIPLTEAATSASVRGVETKTATVGSREETFQRAVDVTLTFAPAIEVKASAEGIVTQLDVKPGDVVASGSLLGSVDGAPIKALVSASPLFRDLSLGLRGPDVGVIAGYLNAVGFLTKVEGVDTFGLQLARAVRRYQTTYGFLPDGIFRQTYVAFVPPAASTIDILEVHVGDAVGGRWPFFKATALPYSVSIRSSSEQSSLSELANAPLEFRAGSLSTSLTSLHPVGEELVNISALLSKAADAGDVSQSGADPSSQGYSGGSLRLANPFKVGAVPVAAIYTAPKGALCVFAEKSNSSDPKSYVAIAVRSSELLSGEVGLVGVEHALAGKRIARDAQLLPAETLKSCR